MHMCMHMLHVSTLVYLWYTVPRFPSTRRVVLSHAILWFICACVCANKLFGASPSVPQDRRVCNHRSAITGEEKK